jgi:hypothetical protein
LLLVVAEVETVMLVALAMGLAAVAALAVSDME